MKLEDLQVYQIAMDIAEQIWNIIQPWDYFAKDTIGKQLVRSSDSIAANLSEGFGRFFFKENKQFCYYSRGSLQETKTWITKAKNRHLINAESFDNLTAQMDTFSVKLNNYIKSIGEKTNHPNDNK
ncbi:MAG: four helix bundle protein [Calditrichaceae bacterium]|jgi:four helix bundle protein